MRWGVRKNAKPMSTREKILAGSLAATSILAASTGVGLAVISVRNTQHKIAAARALAWVENMLDGKKDYQTVSPELFKSVYPNKNTYGVVEQFFRNKDMLKYING